ncbi:hypothetical protein [Arsenicicoccus sp. oral taxon 190]|uniref:hypothetical protein n=1 Tax=Arsenicicoccus sp. oral taxon 190 TaxID=1658671 RepID=UPI00067A1B56|nr:hypothetical protein [Arsenicicoccus sp. oral taxon 190]AKT51787.1 hypothetical protein ADJ73_11770 [Arsenicicoccus sp. oral taxon 190]
MATSVAPAWTLTGINVYPVKGEPGRSLRQAVLTDSGLVGDRAKKRPLLVATSRQADGDLRANLVVDMTDEELDGLQGQELRIGDVVVRLGARPSACDGLYAETVQGGDVLVGDRARVVRCCASF